MTNSYDAIVIGARCAGSPSAMLLARRGYRVLVVDKATFPSDTLSTHLIHAPGIAALKRWGLADDVIASNCPAITTYAFDFGPFVVSGSPRPFEGNADAYAPRRQVLDTILVEAAAKAGAEVRQGFTVDEILIDDGVVTGIRGHDAGGQTVTEHARVVIGADGRHSLVAKAVEPERYNERPVLMSPYYTYWSGIPFETFTAYVRENRGFGVFPTNDDLTLIVVGWPNREFQANRGDIEGNYLKAFEQAPEMADQVRAGNREDRFHGSSGEPNFYRKPFGPGWVLVGDAGYMKDPITAHGISDAFRDVELVVDGLDDTFCERQSFDQAMGHYQQVRDEHTFPIYDFTCQMASMEPPPPEMQQVLGAVSASKDGGDGFASIIAGTMPVPEFFSPDNIGRIMAAN